MKGKSIFLLAIAFSVVIIGSSSSVFGETTSEELNAHIREQIEKTKKEKEKQHPKVDYHLTDVEDAYEKGGAEAAVKKAKETGLNIKNGQIRVHIIMQQGVSAKNFDVTSLEAYGVNVIKGAGDTLQADIPYGRFREVADQVEKIILIVPLTEPEAQSN